MLGCESDLNKYKVLLWCHVYTCLELVSVVVWHTSSTVQSYVANVTDKMYRYSTATVHHAD